MRARGFGRQAEDAPSHCGKLRTLDFARWWNAAAESISRRELRLPHRCCTGACCAPSAGVCLLLKLLEKVDLQTSSLSMR